jgi:UDP:flavonoid glycosyltransferase YjiC (YdhE family)
MASVLLAALAGMGAADHAVTLAERLRERGHRVSVLTAAGALEQYRSLGFEVHAVPEPPMPELKQTLPPVAQRAHQLYTRVQRNVIEPIPGQWAVVSRVLQDAAVDVVVTDGLFVGAAMMSALPRSQRPAVIMLGFHAPWIPDPIVPPYGMGFAPADDGANRIRAGAFELLASRAMAVLSRSFNAEIERTFGVHLRGDLRASPAFADVWAQLTVPRFEYPRTALPPNFRFVGPLHPTAVDPIPEWWDPIGEPPVIAVRSRGETALRDLVLPTLQAFGGTEDTVIVAGTDRGATARASPGPIPDNVHFEDALPWSRLIPKRTVVVSDGDYLHSQHALRQGIPLVLAGTLETDVETAARVAWAGAGVDLRTSRPSAAAIRSAVQRIRADASYRTAAARIAAQIAATDAEDSICDLVDASLPVDRMDSAAVEPD